MIRIKPFGALRPRPDHAASVAAPPYDVVDRDEARAIARDNPYCFLHVTRPEVDFSDDVDPHDDRVYKAAADKLRQLRRNGIFERESGDRIYLYRQEVELLGKKRSQTGVVCCCHIDDYSQGLIKKHEKTRKAKEDDRTRHVLETNCNAGPVFLMHRDQPEIAALVQRDTKGAPLYEITASDGVRHTIWFVQDNAAYVNAFAKLPALYVADGHHRAASAARAGAERRAANPNHKGNEEYNWFLTVNFPASQLTILPYNRIVADLAGLAPGDLVAKLKDIMSVEALAPGADPAPPTTGVFSMYLDGKWFRLALPPESIDRTDAVASLDYQLLSERILEPILGIGDIRTDARIDFVGGIRGTDELKRRVDEGRAAVAFAMHAVTIDQLMAVADAGQIMPPKSTWFEPKLADGLVSHVLD
jgi:uncharacterized protein (DUF1015 family)